MSSPIDTNLALKIIKLETTLLCTCFAYPIFTSIRPYSN
jgi:hypothetical protein